MADITSSDFKQLIQAQQETNKLLRLKQVSDSKPDPEKYIKEELLPSKKLAAEETKEREAVDNANEGVSEALSLGIIEEQEKTTKAILAMSAADDLTTRLKVAEEAAKAELTEKANIKSAKETSAFQKMGKFFDGFSKKFDKIPGSKSLMAILKGTLFGGALLALLSFIQSPEFGEILKTLTGPIARGLAYLWTDIIKPIGNFLMGMITGNHPFLTGIRELGKDFGFSEENSNGLATVIGGLAAALTVAVIFKPFAAAGFLIGTTWKLGKLFLGIGVISKVLSGLGLAIGDEGAKADKKLKKANNKRLKDALKTNPNLGRAVIGSSGEVVREFTKPGVQNAAFASASPPPASGSKGGGGGSKPSGGAIKKVMSGPFGKMFKAFPLAARVYSAHQLYGILTSGKSPSKMVPDVAEILGELGGGVLGGIAGATIGSAVLPGLGTFVGGIGGAISGAVLGGDLALGLAQFGLDQRVTAFSPYFNGLINGDAGLGASGSMDSMVDMERSGVGGIPGQNVKQEGMLNPSSFSGMDVGETGNLSPGARAAKAKRLNPNGQDDSGAASTVAISADKYDQSSTATTYQTFATNLFPNDPVMHQVALAK